MATILFKVNGKNREISDIDPTTPLLWALRDHLGMVGTKYGCGKGLCGACTVHLNGAAVRSCVTPVQTADNQQITTIEGIRGDDGQLHPVQQAWIDEQIPQCGYCQSGQIMSATALLAVNTTPSGDDIDQAMSGNVCRCGTYGRIRKGIESAARVMAAATAAEDSSHG